MRTIIRTQWLKPKNEETPDIFARSFGESQNKPKKLFYDKFKARAIKKRPEILKKPDLE